MAVTKKTAEKIRELKTYLNSSKTISGREVIEVYNQFATETGNIPYRKRDSGCASCIIRLVKIMNDYLDAKERKEEKASTEKPKQNKGKNKGGKTK